VISRRWQRQGTASAHMMAVGRSAPSAISRASAAWNGGVAV
jgi:hypothetical protein